MAPQRSTPGYRHIEFYEQLGFRAIGGEQAQNWLIMLTFNPGWDRNANTLADFDDVRELQRPREPHAHRSRRQPHPD